MLPPVPPSVKEGRITNNRETDLLDAGHSFFQRAAVVTFRQFEADLIHGRLEERAVLGLFYGGELGADEFDFELVENARLGEVDGEVEPGLSSQCRKQRLRSFALDDLCKHFRHERLDIGVVGHLGIGHNGGGIAVNQHYLVALLPEGFARLGAGIVELASLPDYDRA